ICLRLLRHLALLACSLALLSVGKRSPARIAIMAMTTRSSISVNAFSARAKDTAVQLPGAVVNNKRRSMSIAAPQLEFRSGSGRTITFSAGAARYERDLP